jgi:hypothetical protein
MKKNEKGFGIVEIILILVLLCFIGGVGWLVYQSSNNSSQPVTHNSQQSDNTAASTDQEVTQTPPVTDKFLEVPELGVKFKLSPDIIDAYYDPSSLRTGEDYANIELHVHALDSVPECKTGSTAQISKMRNGVATPEVFGDGKKISDVYPGVTMGEYHYAIIPAQYSCVDDKQNWPLLQKVRAAFRDASTTIEKL